MSTLLLLQQLLILFAMALCGFGITRAGLLSETGRKQFAALIVHLFNPLLILSSVCNYDASEARGLVGQNFALAVLVHTFLFAAGFLYVRLLRIRRRERSLYTMAIGMNNIAYMGIPLIRGSLGEEYVIFIAFYILFFNVLVYTLGVHLARNMADKPAPFSARGLLNVGTITSLVAILLFLFRLRPPAQVLHLSVQNLVAGRLPGMVSEAQHAVKQLPFFLEFRHSRVIFRQRGVHLLLPFHLL